MNGLLGMGYINATAQSTDAHNSAPTMGCAGEDDHVEGGMGRGSSNA